MTKLALAVFFPCCLLMAGTLPETSSSLSETSAQAPLPSSLEERVAALETEVLLWRKQSQAPSSGDTYAVAGIELLVPRSRSFAFSADTGLGLGGGVGRYLTSHQVVEAQLAWDAHAALVLKYRFEYRPERSRVFFGPVIGARTKLFDLSPFDNFLESPRQVRSSFLIGGIAVGINEANADLVFEASYWGNSQVFFVGTASMRVFL